MEFSGFKSAPGAWGENTAWHMFGPVDFNLDQVMAFANVQADSCIVEKLKWDLLDSNVFKVFIKTEEATYKFHILFSTKDGKLYKQTIRYNKKTTVSIPVEINIEE